MANLFGARAECPVDRDTKEWLDDCWAGLIEQFGLKRLQRAEVILPRAEFFPDAFAETQEAARAYLDRVCDYMELSAASIDSPKFPVCRFAYNFNP